MTETLARERSILEYFVNEVFPAARLVSVTDSRCMLSIPVDPHFVVTVFVTSTEHGVRTEVAAPALHAAMGPDAIARAGGMLIKVSNLVRQIGVNPRVERRSQTAV